MGEGKARKVVLCDPIRTDLGGIDRPCRDCIYLKNVFQQGKQELLGYLVILGKYFERDGKRMLPLAIQVHHAVCDGYHVGAFVERLQKYIDEF